MAKKYSSNHSGRGITGLLIAIVVIVLGLGVYAVYGKVSDGIKANRLASGNATIEDRADAMGMETDEFLDYLGLGDSGLNGGDAEADMYDKMTIGNFAKYNGSEFTDETFAEFKTAMELGDDVTLDSTDSEVKTAYVTYVQQQQAAEEAASQAGTDAAAEADGADAASDAESDAAEADGTEVPAETAEE